MTMSDHGTMPALTMDGRQRFWSTLRRRPVDRPAWWLGEPVPEALAAPCRHYAVDGLEALKRRLDDDVWSVNIPFHCPPHHHIACAPRWAKDRGCHERTLTAPGFLEGRRDPAGIDDFPWPDPLACLNAEEIRAAFAAVPPDKAALGLLWSCHLQDAFAAFGMEDAMMCLLEAPAMFAAVIECIVAFHLQANAFIYQAAGRRLDAVLIGNDVGCQTGLTFPHRSHRLAQS
jgi:uroporphyrinogen decarboxylase